jgi:hypothetical protein
MSRPPIAALTAEQIFSSAACSSSGVVVVSSADAQRLLVFDAETRFLRQVGVSGHGPGEFERIASFQFSAGDSLYVLDGRRVHVFAPDWKHVRTRTLPAQAQQVLPYGSDGSLVLAGFIQTAAAAGYAAHVLRSDGAVLRSLGTVNPGANLSCETCRRGVGRGPGRDVVLFPPNRYAWETWRPDGTARERISITGAPWFRDWEASGRWMTRESPRPSSLAQVGYADTHTVWIRAIGAPPNWRADGLKVLPPGVHRTGNGGIGFESLRAMEDFEIARELTDMITVFEVVDLERRRVAASLTVAGVYSVIGWPYVAHRRRLESGEFVLDLFRLVGPG